MRTATRLRSTDYGRSISATGVRSEVRTRFISRPVPAVNLTACLESWPRLPSPPRGVWPVQACSRWLLAAAGGARAPRLEFVNEARQRRDRGNTRASRSAPRRAVRATPVSGTKPHLVRVQEIDLGRLHPQLPKKGRHLTAMVALVVQQVQDHAPQWVGPRLPSGTDAGYRALEGFLS